jgi:sRNA-binding regulator protein Hfq
MNNKQKPSVPTDTGLKRAMLAKVPVALAIRNREARVRGVVRDIDRFAVTVIDERGNEFYVMKHAIDFVGPEEVKSHV